MSGIYQIVNKINNKRYIGSASFLNIRERAHLNKLKNNLHENKYLQRSYNKYGKENFKFEIILYCDKENLIFYEQRAINFYTFKKLYNISPTAGNTLGVKYSEESKKRMSIAQRNMSNETKEKIRKSKIGTKHSKETKIKISKNRKGKNCGKLNNNYGKIFSQEEKLNLSKKIKGRKHTNAARKKISRAGRGRKLSEEQKRKISLIHKGKKMPEYIKQKLIEANTGRTRSKWHEEKLLKAIRKPIKTFIYETGDFIGEFESLTSCAKKLNLTNQRISDVLLGKENRKHHKGYTFEFIN
jgi:group I intron endonuclease